MGSSTRVDLVFNQRHRQRDKVYICFSGKGKTAAAVQRPHQCVPLSLWKECPVDSAVAGRMTSKFNETDFSVSGRRPVCPVCFHLPGHLPWFPDLWGRRHLWWRHTFNLFFSVYTLRAARGEGWRRCIGADATKPCMRLAVWFQQSGQQGVQAAPQQPLSRWHSATSWCTFKKLAHRAQIKYPLPPSCCVNFKTFSTFSQNRWKYIYAYKAS